MAARNRYSLTLLPTLERSRPMIARLLRLYAVLVCLVGMLVSPGAAIRSCEQRESEC